MKTSGRSLYSRSARLILSLLALISASFLNQTTHAQIYEQRQSEWSQQDELRFSSWVAKQVDTDWLKKSENPFYNLPVDCADLIYLLRLAFAFENEIEFRISNSAVKISSRTTRFNHIRDPIERVRAFARFIFENTNTLTLIEDTELVPLTKEHLRPGVILLADRKRRHAWVLKTISNHGIPELLSSSTTQRPDIFKSYYYPAHESAFPLGQITAQKGGGFRRFKTISQNSKSNRSAHPASFRATLSDQINSNVISSLNQLTLPTEKLFQEVTRLTRRESTTPDIRLTYMMADLCSKVRERTNVVTDALHLLESKRGAALTRIEFDLYSTPRRDQDILQSFTQVKQFAESEWRHLLSLTRDRFTSLVSPGITRESYCPVSFATHRQTGQDIYEPLGQILQRFEKGLVSSNPSDTIARRWGY